MHRSAKRLASYLACAAVPVMLVAGCSDDSGKKSESSPSKSAAPSSSSPQVAPGKYKKLPDPCKAITKDRVKKMLPAVKDENGEEGKSSDTAAHGTCTWSSEERQGKGGINGTQFRWLAVNLQRYDSDPALGSGDKRATGFYNKQVDAAKATDGAKNVKNEPAKDIGDQATMVTYDLKKDGNDFKNQTLVARTANAVVTINFNGAGLAGAKTPDADEMVKDAQEAAKQAVNAIAQANK
ncbi:DUF3558 domain-containing protein [Streptomyces sp. Ru73]|uniref:DUF3558 family protein n=1 Tax=Streptomyces sp. Ru73 TaxID=2080748 RepID=UPI000CDE53FD|nr:DUF3558 family protein [Streptomyces sp. Ru73]POX37575.1 DUF3558 domain-containing protein [Streptomyces sp. Ru73]